MSTGQEEPTAASSQNVPACHNRGVEEERDRCEEGEADCTETGNVEELKITAVTERESSQKTHNIVAIMLCLLCATLLD